MKWIRILIAHLISEALTSGRALVCVNGRCGRRRLDEPVRGEELMRAQPRPPAARGWEARVLSSVGKRPSERQSKGEILNALFVGEENDWSALPLKDIALGGTNGL